MYRRVQLSPEAEVLGKEAAQAYLAWCRGKSVDTAGAFVAAMRRFKEAEAGGLRRDERRHGDVVEREYAQAFRLLTREESA